LNSNAYLDVDVNDDSAADNLQASPDAPNGDEQDHSLLSIDDPRTKALLSMELLEFGFI
jgi:hypothetical protein